MDFPPPGFGFGMQHPGFFPDPMMMYVAMETMMQEARMYMDASNFHSALSAYNRALEIAYVLPGVDEHVAKLLSNRSLALFKIGKLDEALADALNCISHFPNWIKGYWRAAQVFKVQKLYVEMLPFLIRGLEQIGDVPADEDVISFMVEITTILPFVKDSEFPESLRDDFMCILKGKIGCEKTMTKVLQQVARAECWIGVSLLTLGKHGGFNTCLDCSAANCSVKGISISSLLIKLSESEKRNYGIKLAVHILKHGADTDDLEEKLEQPLAHIGVLEALQTGLIDLLRYFVDNCLKTNEQKAACNSKKDSVFHVLIRSGKANTTLGETILRLLLNHGFKPHQKDIMGRLPIQYLRQNEQAYALISKFMSISDDLKQRISHLKMQGNMAHNAQNFQEALSYYNEALSLAENMPQEAAVLLSNRSAVQSNLGQNIEALQDSEASIKCDKKWHKGYWRKGQVLKFLGRYVDSYHAFLDGFEACSADRGCSFLVEAVIVFSLFPGCKKDRSLDRLLTVDRNMWPTVISLLAKAAEWRAVDLLVQERDTLPAGPGGDRRRGAQCLAANLSMKDVPLTSLLPYMETQVSRGQSIHWADEVAVFLVENGSKLQSLKQHKDDTALHATVRICLLTGKKDLLCLVMTHVSREAQTLLDGRGDSLFHVIASYAPSLSVSPQTREMLTKVLLQAGFNMSLRDREGRLPNELVAENSKLKDLMPDKPVDTAKKLKEQGNEAYKNKDFYSAIDLYTEALRVTEASEEKPNQHTLAVLYSNRAECYLKINKCQHALDDALSSVNHDGHWFKAHVRVGRAKLALGDSRQALRAFTNAYRSLDKSASDKDRCEILSELITVQFRSGGQKSATHGIPELPDVAVYLWMRVAYDLICADQWDPAALAFMQTASVACRDTDRPCVRMSVNLRPLCNLTRVKTEDWVLALTKYLLQCGSDSKTISVREGDTYFHATVQMSMKSGVKVLLEYVLFNIVQPFGEENLQDDFGNTVLHIAARDSSVKENYRIKILNLLLKIGVDPFIKNREDRLPIECLPRHESGSVQILAFTMEHASKTKPKKTQQNQSSQSKSFQKYPQQESVRKRTDTQTTQTPSDDFSRPCDRCDECIINAVLLQDTKKREALETLSTILHHNHKEECHKVRVIESIQIAIGIIGSELNPDIPDKLLKIPTHLLERIIIGLAAEEKWRQMEVMVKRAKSMKGKYFLPSFGKKISVTRLIMSSSLRGSEDVKLSILEMVIQNEGKIEDGKSAMKSALEDEHYKVVHFLLSHGVDCSHMTLSPGDTPIHAALTVALKGNFKILELLLEKFEKNPAKFPMCDPQIADSSGDTLLHIVSKTKYSGNTLKATELICKLNLDASVTNKEGKLPVQYITKKNDRRLQFIKLATATGASKAKKPAEKKGSTQKKETEPANKKAMPTEEPPKVEKKTSEKHVKVKHVSQREISKRNIVQSIMVLPDYFFSIFEPPKKSKKETNTDSKITADSIDDVEKQLSTQLKNVVGEEHICREDILCDENDSRELEIDEEVATKLVAEEDSKESQLKESSDEELSMEGAEGVAVDAQMFDNLEWEVECTAEVWKKLQDTKIQQDLKQRAVRKIFLLAKGEWHSHLCIPVRQIPSNLKLYESKLSKGARILWELAIAFSPRCSETDDRLLLGDEEENEKQPVKGGRIYSEIIRVWDIIYDHNKLYRSVQNIVKSHNRGETCIIKRKLKGLKQSQFLAGIKKRYPILFAEIDIGVSEEQLEICQKDWQNLYPPASSNETEYHILKFYSFSSHLVNHVLQNLETKVDFPFRVTDLEHAIINLKSKAPILLLGRSGTGKTTCCLYRLWSQFVSYWTKAGTADAPLLPRNIEFKHDDDDQPSEGEQSEDENEGCVGGRDEKENVEYSIDELGLEVIESEENEVYGEQFDHLHQIFITKNSVLCTEVQKNFNELNHAFDMCKKHTPLEQQDLPHRLQDVDDFRFPLFLNSKQLLMMLDASLPPPYFFDRNDDGSLKIEIRGWMNTDGPLGFLDMLNDDSDDEDVSDEQHGNAFDDDFEDDDVDEHRVKEKIDPRREITYEVFAEEIWPRINKKNLKYHPTLVWTEILSFVKGSFEALAKSTGHLTKEEYLELGRKRAPNFSGERVKIFDLFTKYNHMKSQKFLFDETDLVFNIYKRLKHIDRMPWVIHQIFVDETQDFTQAELCLLIRICQNPNQMFLTGDTAQSIMRGISFRFSDLRSLFFYARKSMHAIDSSAVVEVPKQVYQLTHNYRSHAGILSLASSILDIMVEFFPESFDKLQKDQGLFSGPNPILLESCSSSDLAVLLRGNKRKTSHIEFGAHQAILVVDDSARESIPEELRLGLILTIYEAKGLEFDDVLLYNFFKDSPASKEWRVVTEYLNKLADERNELEAREAQCMEESLVEIDHDVLQQTKRPRPLTFDPNLHKVLNSELKHLYTAVTRARVNVWIFDEDMEKRAPMFEYFKARKLVRSLTVKEDDALTDTMFAEKSNTEEWLQRGDDFMKHCLYMVAAKCYGLGGASEKEKIASAHQMALEASRMKDRPRLMQEQFLFAAEKYIECNMLQKAAICLQNARERELAAQLYEKCGQLERAAETYRRLKKSVEGSRCFEQLGMYNRAIEILYEGELFDMALDSLQRYKMLIKELEQQSKVVPEVLKNNAPSPNYSEDTLGYKSAELFHRYKNTAKMLEALDRLPRIMDRVDFLRRKGYLEHAARILEEDGKSGQAVEMLLENGKFREAISCARRSREDMIIARSLLLHCHVSLNWVDLDKDSLIEEAREALLIFQTRKDSDNEGEAYLILATLVEDDEKRLNYIEKSWLCFEHSKPLENNAGCIAVIEWIIKNSPQTVRKMCREAIKSLENIMTIIKIITKCENPREKEQLKKVFKFFGLQESADDKTFVLHPKKKPRYLKKCRVENQRGTAITVEKVDAHQQICLHFLNLALDWCPNLLRVIEQERLSCIQCPHYVQGSNCDYNMGEESHAAMLHQPYTQEMYMRLINTDILLINLDENILRGTKAILAVAPSRSQLMIETRSLSDKWRQKTVGAEYLLDDLFPWHIHHSTFTDKIPTCQKFLRAIRLPVVQNRISDFLMTQLGQMKMKDKMKNTSIFVKIIFLSKLLNLPLKTKDIMVTYESDLAREFSSRNQEFREVERRVSKFALICDQIQKQTIIRCVAQRFLDAYHYLSCIDSSPLESLIKFTKFTRLLGSKGKLGMLPDYGHFFFWMEVFTSISFFLMARLAENTDFPFFLPASYLAEINLVGGSFERGRQTVQEGVQNLNLKSLQAGFIQERVRALLGMFCRYRTKMNMLQVIFNLVNKPDDKNSIFYPVAERLFVLCLCLVCNVGKSVALDCEGCLMGAIAAIELDQDCPTRLKQAVHQVQCARGLADVAKALSDLLNGRDDTFLICYWNWDKRSRQGIQYESLRRLSCFPSSFLGDNTLDTMQQASLYKFEGPYSDAEDEDVEDIVMTNEEKLKYQEEQRALKDKQHEDHASRVIVRFFRQILLKYRLKNLKARIEEFFVKQELLDRQKLFESIMVDNTMCGFCGVNFAVMQVEDIENDPDSAGDNTTISSFMSDMHKTNMHQSISSQVRKEHEQTTSHVQKLWEFHAFKNFYKLKISKQLQEVSHFIDKFELKSERREDIYTNMTLEIQRLVRYRDTIKSEIQRIIDNHDWGKKAFLEKSNFEMTSTFELVYNYVVETYEEYRKNELFLQSSSSVPHSCTRPSQEDWESELIPVVDRPEHPSWESSRTRKRARRGRRQ